MTLNRLFDLIEETRGAGNWKAAFGEPQQLEGKTIIPVAQVGYAFGLGFGQAPESPQTEGAAEPPAHGEGGGGGGHASSRPLGVIVVTPDRVCFEGITDERRIAPVVLAVGALVTWQLAKTLRAIFGHQ